MQSEHTKSYYPGIDIVKFLLAIVIVASHYPPLTSYNVEVDNWIRFVLCRIAVPFYFIASGFFAFKKINIDFYTFADTIPYLKKILRLYLTWSIISFPIAIYLAVLKKGSIFKGCISWLHGFVFTGSFKQLWYLNATIVAVLILAYLLSRKVSVKLIGVIAIALYGIGLLGQSYYVILEPLKNYDLLWKAITIFYKVIGTTRNGVFFGFLFVYIGMMFRREEFHLRLSKRISVVCFLISMVGLTFESNIVRKNNWNLSFDMYIFSAFAAFFLFSMSKFESTKGISICKTLRNQGVLVFYTHTMIGSIIEIAIKRPINSLSMFLLVLILSNLVAALIQIISKYKHMGFIKKIYI